MEEKYQIEKIGGQDFVSVSDAKKILGLQSAKELRALGSATMTVDDRKPLWNLSWLIDQAKRRSDVVLMNPDTEWIESYKGSRKAHDKRSRQHLVPSASASSSSIATSRRLTELVKLMPPPERITDNSVDWNSLEQAVGVEYPQSFKDFIAVYGGLQWFDWLRPLVPLEGQNVKQFLKSLNGIFDEHFGEDTFDENGHLLVTPRFGADGGWLPFLTGSDGDLYVWIAEGPPEKWRVVCALDRTVTVLTPVSITEMLVSWLIGEPLMENIWGKVSEFRTHSLERLSMLR